MCDSPVLIVGPIIPIPRPHNNPEHNNNVNSSVRRVKPHLAPGSVLEPSRSSTIPLSLLTTQASLMSHC